MLSGVVEATVAGVLQHRAVHPWLPANMVAWGVGMPLVFLGMDLAFRDGGALRTAAVVMATLALTGAVVGVINGSWLTRKVVPRVEP